ncbi:MAG: class I SAM-dependent methyltransferase [Myxococcales bacterium]|jgi:SAM-dependent methyltransferase|nr:class I SAM-dependent methyltransferase [Myxococcales bacterium]HQY59897.1 class I SAM-dependent methyltransferase [Polyangiaceae bacterium]
MNNGFWEERYRAEAYAYGKEPNDFLRAEAGRIPAGRVLCLAEGEGRNAAYLAGLGHDVTAVDFSPEGLQKARRLAAERGVSLTTVHADLAAYEPQRGAYAGVVATFAHLPLEVRLRVHGWVHEALREGGVFVLEAYSPRQLAYDTGGPRDAALCMTLERLTVELAPLEVIVGREIEREIHEGLYHKGPSATVQVVAVRRDSTKLGHLSG